MTYYVTVNFYVETDNADVAVNVANDMYFYGKTEAKSKNGDVLIQSGNVEVEEI